MQPKRLCAVLCAAFSLVLACADTLAADDSSKPKPIKLDNADTLFRIRIFKKVEDLSPRFHPYSEAEQKAGLLANPGTTFDVIGKELDPAQNKKDAAPYYVVVPVEFNKNVVSGSQPTECTTEGAKNDLNTICANKAYRVASKEIDEGYGMVRESLVSGMFIAPFKYYPRTHSFSTTSLTVAPYVGYETNVSTFTAVCKLFSSTSPDDCFDLNWVQKYTYFASLGPSIVSVTDQNKQSSQVFALSAALGIAYDIKGQIKFVMAAGKDWTGSTATAYKYNALPWFAVTLGYTF